MFVIDSDLKNWSQLDKYSLEKVQISLNVEV